MPKTYQIINVQTPEIPTPIIGGKAYVVESFGTFLLARGPGILRCIACTHTGGGYTTFWDDVPDDDIPPRPLFKMHPNIMGHFMLDAGFNNGLIVEVGGNTASPFMTVVWMEKH